VLVGSGLSSAAGVPTGWQVVQDLVRKIARAEGVDEDTLGDTPETWWMKTRGAEPRYDELLSALASTDAQRRAILRTYFEPPASAGGPFQPTAGHRALAALCAAGRIRVLLTTNFDPLLEHALDAAGVGAQVIATASDRAGMTPLPHASATVVKLHGDYTAPMLNTAEELAKYPQKLRALVARIVDEYGLLVVGWSAEYDRALAEVIAACPSRRYPTFWTSYRGSLREPARRLIALRQATVIDTDGADEFFMDIVERIARLDVRAARRGRPTRLHTHSFMIQNTPPQGWSCVPPLQLRAVVCVAPATVDDSGPIGPRERERVLGALRAAPITQALGTLFFSSAPRIGEDGSLAQPPHGRSREDWVPTPGGHQSSDTASYRFGGDAATGVSALVTVHLPAFARGAQVVFTIDVGLPFAAPTPLGEAARLWRDGLLLASVLLPEAVADMLPADAHPAQAELHALAGSPDRDETSIPKPGDLEQALSLALLGAPTRAMGPAMGYAVSLAQAPSEREAAEIVVEAIYQMAIGHGYLDPRVGIAALRAELGLPSAADMWA
jgi:hypothetical protein